MKLYRCSFYSLLFLSFIFLFGGACGKSGTPSPPNPCSGVTVAVTATTSNPSAPGATNGSITAAASGGSGFTFSINGAPFQSSATFSGLAAGSYTVAAKNSNGCTGSSTFTLTAANPCAGVTITVNGTVVNPTAPGLTNGSIAVNASGSTGFTYNINGGTFQSSGTFNTLTAGAYTIVAKDGNACTGSAIFTLTNPNPCNGITITASPSATGTDPCSSPSGMIAVTPGGGTGPYTFQLNSGVFQSSNIFSNLSTGTYSVSARDVNSCIGTTTNVQIPNLPAGPLFNAVRIVLQNNCVSCHNNTTTEGGMNWTVDCNIVMFKDRIQARAVNANPSSMPPTGLIAASERQKIIDWINAGGKYIN